MWTYLSGREEYVCRDCMSMVEWTSTPGEGKCKCKTFKAFHAPSKNPPRTLAGVFAEIGTDNEKKNDSEKA